MSKLSHDAEILYLQDLRALETVSHMLSQKFTYYEKEKNKFKNDNAFLKSDIVVESDREEFPLKETASESLFYIIGGVVFGALFGAFMGLCCGIVECTGYQAYHIWNFLMVGLVLGAAASIILFVVRTVDHYFHNAKAAKKYDKDMKERAVQLAKRQALLPKNEKLIELNERFSDECRNEYRKAYSLLQKYYSLNIIPVQYRNIQAIYYIYNFVSTSPYGIEQALENYMHQEIANKLDIIISQMNTIIEQQSEIIVSQRRQEARLKDLQASNEKMLHRLSSIEQDAAVSAQYSQMASTYAEAGMYFSAATYLQALK